MQTAKPLKRYYSKIPGSRFCFKDGSEARFNYGYFETNDAVKQAELDAVLGSNPMIYTQDVLLVQDTSVANTVVDPLKNALSEAEIAAQDARLAGIRTIESGELNPLPIPEGMPPGHFPNPALNTVDVNLQAAVANAPKSATVAPPPQTVGATQVNPVTQGEETLPAAIGPGASALEALKLRQAMSAGSVSK